MPDNENNEQHPWGDDFDPAKAWSLIVGLRADKTELAGKLTTATEEIATLTQAVQDAAAKSNDADLTKAQEDLKAATRELYVERALRKHPGIDDLADLLTGDDEEAINKTAARLAKLATPAPKNDAAKNDDEKKPADEKNSRPKPDLTPGHSTGDDGEPDIDSVVKNIRAARY